MLLVMQHGYQVCDHALRRFLKLLLAVWVRNCIPARSKSHYNAFGCERQLGEHGIFCKVTNFELSVHTVLIIAWSALLPSGLTTVYAYRIDRGGFFFVFLQVRAGARRTYNEFRRVR